MNVTKKISIFIIFILLSLIIHSSPVSSERTNEEWKSILAIGDGKDNLTGVNLFLNIEPEKYYFESGSEIVLSGSLAGVFGPLTDTPVVIERVNATNDTAIIQTATDNQGIFMISDILMDEGINRYQAIFYPSDNSSEDAIMSNKYEVRIFQSFRDDYSPDVISNITLNITEDFFKNNQENLSVLISGQPALYYPGNSISISGGVIKDQKPVPYATVKLFPYIQNEQNLTGPPISFQTRSNGTIESSFHLPGSNPVGFFLEYQEDKNGPIYRSDTVLFTPSHSGVNPPPKIVQDEESIELFQDNESVDSMQNITFYGWHTGKRGINQPLTSLEIIWYNFGEKLWDKYQSSSLILTNGDGKFECNLQAPQTAGTYLIAVQKPGNTTSNPVFSNVIALTVQNPVSNEETSVEYTGMNSILIEGHPPQGIVGDQLELFIHSENSMQVDLQDYQIFPFYSDNGLEWKPIQSTPLSINTEAEPFITIVPDKPGYWYFRVILGNDSTQLAESNVLVVPVVKKDT